MVPSLNVWLGCGTRRFAVMHADGEVRRLRLFAIGTAMRQIDAKRCFVRVAIERPLAPTADVCRKDASWQIADLPHNRAKAEPSLARGIVNYQAVRMATKLHWWRR